MLAVVIQQIFYIVSFIKSTLVEAINKSNIKRVEQIINALTNCFNYLNYHAEFFFTDEYRFTLSQFLDKPIHIERQHSI